MNKKLLAKKLKTRYIKVILYLLKLNYPISTKEISEHTGVKIRTLKNDLKFIGDFLSSYRVSLVTKRGVGVYIEVKNYLDKKKLKEDLINIFENINPDKNERFKAILSDCLLKDKIPTIEDWSFEFNISRPTVLKDINHVKKWLKDRKLYLIGKPGKGYTLKGKEEDIRDAIAELLLKDKESQGNINGNRLNLKLKEEIFRDINIPILETFLNKIEEITKNPIVDMDFLNLIYKLAITITRIKNNHLISMDPKKVFDIMQTPTYRIIFENVNMIENQHKIKFPLEEVAYIALSFITSKIRDSFSLEKSSLVNSEKYLRLAKRIALISEDVSGLPMAYDDEFIRMLSLHLKAMLTKIRYGIKVENPLLEEIKRDYPLSFSIAKKVSQTLEKEMHVKIPEEEVGYIAMYIAMIFEKIRHRGIKKKKVAVICSSGMATSSVLFWRLLNEMPDIDVVQVGSYKDILEKKIEPDLDLIISTVPLPDINLPYIVVSPFLNSNERKLIREKLGILRYKSQSPSLSYIDDVLDEDLIFKDLPAKNNFDAIKLMGKVLIKKGIVKKGFIDAVIKREEEFPTGLNTPIPIALPHTGYNFSIKEGFSIAILKQPVEFKDMGDSQRILKVKIVFIPVLLPNGRYNTIFYKLLEKIIDIKIARKLILSKNSKEAKKIIIKSFFS